MAILLPFDSRPRAAWPAKPIEITPAQFRAARALLDWSRADLAARTSLQLCDVIEVERGTRFVSAEVKAVIRFFLEDSGVEFLAESGDGLRVRLRQAAAAPASPADGPRRRSISGAEEARREGAPGPWGSREATGHLRERQATSKFD